MRVQTAGIDVQIDGILVGAGEADLAIEANIVAAFEGELPAMSSPQFEALVEARKRRGHILSDEEARAELQKSADGGHDGHE